MSLYLCRWENGDFSLVQARNRRHAVEMLDAQANAEGLPLHAITGFMVHFRLTNEGMLELEGFGGEFGELSFATTRSALIPLTFPTTALDTLSHDPDPLAAPVRRQNWI